MTLEQAKKDFLAAVEEFNKDIGFDPAGGISIEALNELVAKTVGKAKVTNSDALAGCKAGVVVLCKLVDASTNYKEIEGYTVAIYATREEAVRLREEILTKSGAAYKPFQDAFVEAAGTLKKALDRAKAQMQGLNLAADVLSIFARLLTVL